MVLKFPAISLQNVFIVFSFFFAINRIFRWRSKFWKGLMNVVYTVSFGLAAYRLVSMFLSA